MNFKSVLCAATLLAASGVAQAFPDYTLYPADGRSFDAVDGMTTLNLTFEGMNDIVVAADAMASLMNDDGDEIYSYQFEDFMNSGTIIIKFDSSEIETNGTWDLTIPAGSVTVNGEENPVINASYTLNDPLLNIGEFPQITLESIDPADGAKLPAFGGDDFPRIYMKTSDDAAVNHIEWSLYDVTDGLEEFVRFGNENRYDLNRYDHTDDNWAEGLWINIQGTADKLVEGHKYRLTLRFCGIGYDVETNQYPSPDQLRISEELVTSVYYEGLTPAPEYAEATYVSITPDPLTYEIDNPDLAFFDILYSAPAKPVEFVYSLGMGGGLAPAGTFAPAEGAEVNEKGLADRWTFTFDRSLVASSVGTIITSVSSMDADGLYVKGNGGYLFDDNYYTMSWSCNCGATALTAVSPEAGAEVESLSSITISNEKNFIMNVSGFAEENARIVTRTGEEVRVLGFPEMSEDETQATWTFDPIETPNTYILIIPKQYFFVGEEFEGTISNETTFSYTVISNGSSEVAYDLIPEITPEDGSTVETLSKVTVDYGSLGIFAIVDEAWNPISVGQLFKKTNDGYALIEEVPFVENDMFNPTGGDYTFAEPITEEGEYRFVIPQGSFGNEEYTASLYGPELAGRANPVINLSYTVGNGSTPGGVEYSVMPVSVTPENKTTVDEISTVTVEFAEVVFQNQQLEGFEVTFVEGVLYRLGEDGAKEELQKVAPFDNPASDFMNPTIYDFSFETVTEKGQYEVFVPQATFCDSQYLDTMGESGKANPEFSLYYAVGESVGVDAIVGGADIINVYDLNGVQILKNANVEEAKNLDSGLYIINGKKVIIRR